MQLIWSDSYYKVYTKLTIYLSSETISKLELGFVGEVSGKAWLGKFGLLTDIGQLYTAQRLQSTEISFYIMWIYYQNPISDYDKWQPRRLLLLCDLLTLTFDLRTRSYVCVIYYVYLNFLYLFGLNVKPVQ